MFFVYILYSSKCDRYYKGYSQDPELRLAERHNKGLVAATRNCFPYELKYKKAFNSESEAMREEKRLKKLKSRVYLEQLIVSS